MPRRLPSGRWQGCVVLPGSTKRVYETFGLRRDAREWEQDTRALLRRGEWRDPKLARMLFEVWAGRWSAARNVEPETAYNDASPMRCHVTPRWAGTPLGAIGRLEVQSWVTAMGKAGVGAPTVLKAYGLFAAIMAAAVDEDIITRTPCRKITLPEPPTRKLKWWEAGEVDWIVAQLPEPWATIACLMCWCGLRWEEAAGLPVEDVNWLRREITVTQVITKHRRIKKYPKNGHAGVRTLKMAGPVADRLLPAWEAARNERGASGLIWVTRGGRPVSLNQWAQTWEAKVRVFRAGTASATKRRAAPEPERPWAVVRGWAAAVEWHRTRDLAVADAARRRAAATTVPYHSPHTLRHTGASWLVQAGVPLADIGRWLGHAPHSKQTARYAHLAPEKSNVTVGEALGKLGSTASPDAAAN